MSLAGGKEFKSWCKGTYLECDSSLKENKKNRF